MGSSQHKDAGSNNGMLRMPQMPQEMGGPTKVPPPSCQACHPPVAVDHTCWGWWERFPGTLTSRTGNMLSVRMEGAPADKKARRLVNFASFWQKKSWQVSFFSTNHLFPLIPIGLVLGLSVHQGIPWEMSSTKSRSSPGSLQIAKFPRASRLQTGSRGATAARPTLKPQRWLQWSRGGVQSSAKYPPAMTAMWVRLASPCHHGCFIHDLDDLGYPYDLGNLQVMNVGNLKSLKFIKSRAFDGSFDRHS